MDSAAVRQNAEKVAAIIQRFSKQKNAPTGDSGTPQNTSTEPFPPVVIFSPSRHSLYTIGVAELLRQTGVPIAAIVVRRLFNLRRFSSEFARDGSRLLRKIWLKLFLRRLAYPTHAPYQTLPQFLNTLGSPARSVDDFQKHHKIPVIYCRELNDNNVVEILKKTTPRLVVFTGGGLIRDEVLKLSGDGVLNCHMGILPHYRGMDVVEWPLLENHPEHIGMTVHFMDKGVDTGDVLSVRHISPVAGENRHTLRGRFEVPMCQELAATTIACLSHSIPRIPQPPPLSRQYFKLHPSLMQIAETRLPR